MRGKELFLIKIIDQYLQSKGITSERLRHNKYFDRHKNFSISL